MKKKHTSKKSKKLKQDKHNIQELTDEFFEQAVPFKEALPELHASWKRGRGRPKLLHPKCEIKLRIDHEVLESFKSQGKGWQTKINHALCEWAKQHGML